jgi:dihydrolipoamide dehydrogenase
LELGSVYRRLGSEVVVLEYLDKICPFLDSEISSNFKKILEK